MQYRIKSLRVNNFKCFDDSKFYEFSFDEEKNPIILTGPNGFGKTTFFDALELIFSKNITRFETKIENKNTNLLKNVLLNKAEQDGYIVVTLVNKNKEYITLMAKIDHTKKKVVYSDSINFGIEERYIETQRLNDVLNEYDDWKENLTDFDRIKYNMNEFGVYYYISQAESVHFLKKNMSERKSTLDALLEVGNASTWSDFVKDELIGKTKSTKGVLVNGEIERVNYIIKEDVSALKECYEKIQDNDQVEYAPILLCDEVLYWDVEKLDDFSEDELNSGLAELDRLSSYVKEYSDYEKHVWNKRLEAAINPSVISDMLLCIPYISHNGKLEISKVNQFLEEQNRIIEVYNRSAFFRTDDFDVSMFKCSDMERLKEIDEELIKFDIHNLNNLCEQIKLNGQAMSDRQNVIIELEKAREKLHSINEQYNKDSSVCPYCNRQYTDLSELSNGFNAAKMLLDKEKGKAVLKNNDLMNQVKEIVAESKQKVDSLIKKYDDVKINDLLTVIKKLKNIINDKNKLDKIELIYSLIFDKQEWRELDNQEQISEISRICLDFQKTYDNDQFCQHLKDFNYPSISETYPEINWDMQLNLKDKEKVNNKKKYIQLHINQKRNQKAQTIKQRLKENLIRLDKLERIRENLNSLGKIYDKSIEQYKNQVLRKLRVPLLIYTAKILQDYQNGLGVFIDKDEMRFVSNCDAKHDILNTFSSGQLSGFVLAFLFSMHKQYIKESEDDLGFILIDDPVQTMDDINISSMIEVLRNDFSSKQIIMSTHEMDKENYILYKFYKYNITGQSFNVKDNLYGLKK